MYMNDVRVSMLKLFVYLRTPSMQRFEAPVGVKLKHLPRNVTQDSLWTTPLFTNEPAGYEKALRAYIEKQGPEFLTSLNVETIDDLFVSPRDGEPYVVIYGKTKNIVAYEAVRQRSAD